MGLEEGVVEGVLHSVPIPAHQLLVYLLGFVLVGGLVLVHFRSDLPHLLLARQVLPHCAVEVVIDFVDDAQRDAGFVLQYADAVVLYLQTARPLSELIEVLKLVD